MTFDNRNSYIRIKMTPKRVTYLKKRLTVIASLIINNAAEFADLSIFKFSPRSMFWYWGKNGKKKLAKNLGCDASGFSIWTSWLVVHDAMTLNIREQSNTFEGFILRFQTEMKWKCLFDPVTQSRSEGRCHVTSFFISERERKSKREWKHPFGNLLIKGYWTNE